MVGAAGLEPATSCVLSRIIAAKISIVFRQFLTSICNIVNGSRRVIKTLIKALSAKAGVGIFRLRGRYAQDGLFTVHSDRFRADAAFRAAYARGGASQSRR